ncbi:hypothetical protein J2X69_003030 [Algoriphagus sp. 4150]|uniref:hypothetical protein n=1 Tax=Algoriphagus sp. 4150 TaxID=2817756 RepID=UPI0028659E01|nr:hypothetical protein [Algoriphagus sp. 4150]MDR7130673.1 hypothetical protein [Algoriphagus sp. 4150]
MEEFKFSNIDSALAIPRNSIMAMLESVNNQIISFDNDSNLSNPIGLYIGWIMVNNIADRDADNIIATLDLNFNEIENLCNNIDVDSVNLSSVLVSDWNLIIDEDALRIQNQNSNSIITISNFVN